MLKKRHAILPAIVAVGVLLYAVREPILLAVGDYLVVQDSLQPADVIHVIAGPDDRTDYAIQLYQQGYGKRIVFTGGWCTSHGYYHGQHGAERAEAQGVPPSAIDVDESPVKSTYDEAVLVRDLTERAVEPARSVIVVSDPYHMRRAQWTYRYLLDATTSVQMAPLPFSRTEYRRRWWSDPASRDMVGYEYLKLAYYIVRYQWSRGPLQEWLGTLDRE